MQAAAKPSQPGKPQPPQLIPGRTSRIFTTRSSTFTAKIFWKIPSRIPRIKATTKETITVEMIICILKASYFISPENPRNESERKPAAMNRIGFPLRNAGIGAISSLSRTPDMITIESKNPPAEPNAYTRDST